MANKQVHEIQEAIHIILRTLNNASMNSKGYVSGFHLNITETDFGGHIEIDFVQGGRVFEDDKHRRPQTKS